MDIPRLPRTMHMQGSGLPERFEGRMSYARLDGHLIVEEKLDGRGIGVCFSAEGDLLLGVRSATYNKRSDLDPDAAHAWDYLQNHLTELYLALSDRYVLYGEHLYNKHFLFYDQLPSYFFESDIFDRQNEQFLTLTKRQDLLKETDIHQVPILWQGDAREMPEPQELINQSIYQTSNWRENLDRKAKELHLPNTKLWQATDMSDLSEGLYIRTEDNEYVTGRYKVVRPEFIRSIKDLPHWSWQGIRNSLSAPVGFNLSES